MDPPLHHRDYNNQTRVFMQVNRFTKWRRQWNREGRFFGMKKKVSATTDEQKIDLLNQRKSTTYGKETHDDLRGQFTGSIMRSWYLRNLRCDVKTICQILSQQLLYISQPVKFSHVYRGDNCKQFWGLSENVPFEKLEILEKRWGSVFSRKEKMLTNKNESIVLKELIGLL